MYTDDQIRQFAQTQGIANNPIALAANQQIYGVSNNQMDSAFGWNPGTAGNWWQQQQEATPSMNGQAQSSAQPQNTFQGNYGQTQGGQQQQGQQSGNPYMGGQAQSWQGGGGMGPTGAPTQSGNPVSNPYLMSMASGIAQQSTDNLQRNILPQIRGGAIQNGGLGGSRQGVVEANAIRDTQNGITNSLASLYGGAYENQQGRDLQRYGMDQNFYSTQRGLDFQGQRLGADLFQQGMQGLSQQGQGLYQTGMQEQAAGMLPYQQFANLLGPFTGLNQTNTNSTDTSGNVLGGAIAGGLTLAQLYRLFSNGG